jgi:3-phosphoglycerate kinase
MKSIDQAPLQGKKVLVRVDYNVPLNEQFEVTDTTRIKRTKQTVDKIAQTLFLRHRFGLFPFGFGKRKTD